MNRSHNAYKYSLIYTRENVINVNCCDPIKNIAKGLEGNIKFKKHNKALVSIPFGFLKTDSYIKEEEFIIEWILILRNDFGFTDIEYYGIEQNDGYKSFIVGYELINDLSNWKALKPFFMFKNHLIRMIYKKESMRGENKEYQMTNIIKQFKSIKQFKLDNNIDYDPLYTFYFATLGLPYYNANANFFPHFPVIIPKKMRSIQQYILHVKNTGATNISDSLYSKIGYGLNYTLRIKSKKKIQKEYRDAKSQGGAFFKAYLNTTITKLKI